MSTTGKMPLLDSCCGRWSLKTGSIISGALGVIMGAVTLIFILTTEVKMRTIVIDTLPPTVDGNDATNQTDPLFSPMKKYEVKFVFDSRPNKTSNYTSSQHIPLELLNAECIDNRLIYLNDTQNSSHTDSIIHNGEPPFCLSDTEVKIIVAINLVMTMLISALLIVAVLKRNRFMMLPWVILAIMVAIGLGISVIYTAIVYFIHSDPLGGTLFLIFGLLSVVIFIYLWFVVFSFYQLLQEEKGRGPYDRSAYRR